MTTPAPQMNAGSFVPLTPEQFQSAIKAGFSPEKIIANEQIRKNQMMGNIDNNESKPWSQNDQHIIPQLGDTLLGTPNSDMPNPIAAGIRPILNLPTSLARGVEDAVKIPFNAYDLAKEQGVIPAATNFGTSLFQNITAPLSAVGNTIMGTVGAGVKKLTGVDINSPESAQAFNTAKNAVTHPLDTAANVAKTIYQTSQENPMNIPLALEAGASSINKAVGREVLSSPISKVSSVTKNATSSATDSVLEATHLDKPISAAKDYIKDAALNKRVEDFSKVFNQSKSTLAAEAKYEKNSPKFAAQLEQEGVELPFGKDARGRLDTTAAQTNVEEVAARDNETMNRLLESSGTNVNLDNIENAAVKAARQTYKGTAQRTAIQHIYEEMSAYREQYADQGFYDNHGSYKVPSQIANEIKQDLWGKSKFPALGTPTDQTKAGTSFLMGNAIKDSIEKEVGGDNIVGRLNQRLGDIQSLSRTLQKSQGGAIHGGFVSRMAGRVVGGIAGSGGGPAGTVIGAITGDMISEALNNPNRPLSWSQAVLRRAQTEMPDILKEAEARIGKNAQDILDRKGLPAKGGSSAPMITPAPTTYENAAQNIQRQFNPTLELPAGEAGRVAPSEVINLPGPKSPTEYEKAAENTRKYVFNPKDKKYYQKGKFNGGASNLGRSR